MFGEVIKIQTQQVGDLVDRPMEVDLECVWGNTKGTLVTRDSIRTRYRSHKTSFFRMDQ